MQSSLCFAWLSCMTRCSTRLERAFKRAQVRETQVAVSSLSWQDVLQLQRRAGVVAMLIFVLADIARLRRGWPRSMREFMSWMRRKDLSRAQSHRSLAARRAQYEMR